VNVLNPAVGETIAHSRAQHQQWRNISSTIAPLLTSISISIDRYHSLLLLSAGNFTTKKYIYEKVFVFHTGYTGLGRIADR